MVQVALQSTQFWFSYPGRLSQVMVRLAPDRFLEDPAFTPPLLLQ